MHGKRPLPSSDEAKEDQISYTQKPFFQNQGQYVLAQHVMANEHDELMQANLESARIKHFTSQNADQGKSNPRSELLLIYIYIYTFSSKSSEFHFTFMVKKEKAISRCVAHLLYLAT